MNFLTKSCHIILVNRCWFLNSDWIDCFSTTFFNTKIIIKTGTNHISIMTGINIVTIRDSDQLSVFRFIISQIRMQGFHWLTTIKYLSYFNRSEIFLLRVKYLKYLYRLHMARCLQLNHPRFDAKSSLVPSHITTQTT